MKRIEDSLKDLWDSIKCTNIWIIGVPKWREKEYEKIFEEIRVENLSDIRKETASLSLGNPESPIKGIPKETHAKTHINQTNKN